MHPLRYDRPLEEKSLKISREQEDEGDRLPIQAVTDSRVLTKGEVDLHVGNEARVVALAAGTSFIDFSK